MTPLNTPRPGIKRDRWYRHPDRYLFITPALLVVAGMLIFPVTYTLYLSFHRWSGGLRPPQFIGFGNFAQMFNDGRFWGGLLRTVLFVTIALGSQMVLGVATALLFHRKFRGQGVARTFFMFPMIATPAAMALVWKMMLDPTIGSVSFLIKWLGGPAVAWTANRYTVIPTLALVDTWQWTPLIMLIVLAGLAALPAEPFEAAKLDGASSWQAFVHITLPLLRPVLVVAAMFRMIDCIKTFDIIMIITNGGPGFSSEILNLYAFKQALSFLHLGYGSALLVALTAVVFGAAIALNHFRRASQY